MGNYERLSIEVMNRDVRLMLLSVDMLQELADGLRCLYETSFPREERRDWDAWFSLAVGESMMEVYGVWYDDDFVGFVSAWKLLPDTVYLEHFALSQEVRSRGLGSRVLALICSEIAFDDHLIFEVEPEDANAMSARRIGFYQRNGFELLDYPYQQPSYHGDGVCVPMKLMMRQAGVLSPVSHDKLRSIIQTIYSKVYFQ